MHDQTNPVDQSASVDLFQWLPTRHWVADKGGHLFKTFSSFEWFLRRHRAELIESGHFIPRPGPGGSLCGPGLAAKALEILRHEAQQAKDLQNATADVPAPTTDPEGFVELSVWLKPSEADALRALASARGSAANDLAEELVRDALERIGEGGQL